MTFRAAQLLLMVPLCSMLASQVVGASEREQRLLDFLLENGSISQEQYELLAEDAELPATEPATSSPASTLPPVAAGGGDAEPASSGVASTPGHPAGDSLLNEKINAFLQEKIDKEFPVRVSYGSKGFRLESRDGNWQTNLQWRFQFRLSWPTRSDPRQVSDFRATEKVTFETRRIRMKIGGHGYRPWLKYYFELDLQPTRDTDDSSSKSSTRVIDYRVDVAKYEQIGLRVGQWKIDYNRERVDSSGRQEFVERSIVNRIFTIDRQMGVSLRGRIFKGTPADLRYAFGVFTGEGRGVANDDNNMMYTGRLQWNFLGRELKFRQSDVERTQKPTGSLAVAAATTTGVCTRWSSSGCGNLDGFTKPADARQGQFRIHQAVEEFAFKYQGFSFQQEGHWKRIIDRTFSQGNANNQTDLYGLYVQSGYFFNEIWEAVPEELELAFRYAIVREPNEENRTKTNTRQEFTAAANWFFAGHNNKLTLDYSYLTLDDDQARENVDESRVRLQWDISF